MNTFSPKIIPIDKLQYLRNTEIARKESEELVKQKEIDEKRNIKFSSLIPEFNDVLEKQASLGNSEAELYSSTLKTPLTWDCDFKQGLFRSQGLFESIHDVWNREDILETDIREHMTGVFEMIVNYLEDNGYVVFFKPFSKDDGFGTHSGFSIWARW